MTDALERLAAKRRQMQEIQKQSWDGAMDTLKNSTQLDRVHVTESKKPSETKSDVSATAVIRKNNTSTIKNRSEARSKAKTKPKPAAEKKIEPKPIEEKPIKEKPAAPKKGKTKPTPELTETLLAIASKVRQDRKKNSETDPDRADGPVVKADAKTETVSSNQNEVVPTNSNPFQKTSTAKENADTQIQDSETANKKAVDADANNAEPVVIELPNLDKKPSADSAKTESKKMRKHSEERDLRQYVRIKHAGEEDTPAKASEVSVKGKQTAEKTKKSKKAAIAMTAGCAIVLLGLGAVKLAGNPNNKESTVQPQSTSVKASTSKASRGTSLPNATSTSGQTKAGNVKYTNDEKAVIKKLTAEAAATKKPYQITASSIGGGYILGNISYYPADATKQYNDYSITAPSKASKGSTTDKAKKIEAHLKKNLPTINKTIHVKDKKKVSMATYLVADKTYNTILLYDGKPFGYVQTDKDGRLTNVVTTYYIQKVTSDK